MKMELHFRWERLWRSSCGEIILDQMWSGSVILSPSQIWTLDTAFHFQYNAGLDLTSTTESELLTLLPQDDPYPEQRIRELEYKRRVYRTYPMMYYVVGDENCSANMIKVSEIFFHADTENSCNRTLSISFQRSFFSIEFYMI